MVASPPLRARFRRLLACTPPPRKALAFPHLRSCSSTSHALEENEGMLAFLSRTRTRTGPLCGDVTPLAAAAEAAPSPCSSSLTYEWNTQLKHLVKAGQFGQARNLFVKMPRRDEISWTTLISGYVDARDTVEALRLFSCMRADPSLAIDPFVLSLVVKGCGLAQLRAQGETLHAYSEKVGLKVSSVFVGSALLDMYGKLGLLPLALQVFYGMTSRNVVSWTAMITALVHSGWCEKAVWCFAAMWASGVACDSYTLAIILKACADASMLARGREIHAHALKMGLDVTSFVANALAAMYAKCGRLDRGLILFEGMRNRDVVSWTAMISAYLNEGRHEDAVRAFVMMTTGEGIVPNEYTYAAVLSASTGLVQIPLGEQLHACVIRAGLAASPSVSNAVITMYSCVGRLDAAASVFQELRTRDIVSWSAIVSGHAQEGQIEVAFQLFGAMRHAGTTPNEFTLGSLLSGCGYVAMLTQGQQLHAYALALGLDGDAMVRSALIAMYSRCGNIVDASQVFAGMAIGEEDAISWTAMINGYAEHGCIKEAIELFEKMQMVGLRPDGVTFIGVLTACCHAGLLELGFRYFHYMREVYGIEPRKEHYGCMVDLLGRAGQVERAECLAESMPYKPDDVVWSMLLRACRVHGHTDCGRRAAERILEMHPNCAGTHITLSNIYAAKGRWGEAADARKLMRLKGVKKETGWSWIMVGDCVSVFAAADRMHPEGEQLYALLEELALRAKLMSYDPELSLLEPEAEELAAAIAS